MLTLFNSNKLTIGTIHDHHHYSVKNLNITYINEGKTYILKLQNKKDSDEVFWFEIPELRKIKKFAESVIYLNPELSKEEKKK